MIATIDALKQALSTPENLISNGVGNFDALAKSLMNNFQIMKGRKRYWLTEIEFYLFTESHRDIITYPRRCEAGMWFFHASGVDISFKSNVIFEDSPEKKKWMPILSKGAVFGGILIRGVVREDTLDRPVSGPIRVCDELFDKFDALQTPTDFPQIVVAPKARGVEPTKLLRFGISKEDEKKVHGILTSNYIGFDKVFREEKLVEAYKTYREEGLYRFRV